MQYLSSLLYLQNLDLLSVGIAIAAIGVLGFIVYFHDEKSITNKTFLFFSFLTGIYGIFNYVNYQVTSPDLILWFLRITIFSAVWHAFSLFQFFYVYPKERVEFPKIYTKLLVPIVIFTSLLTLTPLVFSRIIQVAGTGNVTNPERGPGIAIFGLTIVFLIGGGIFNLIKKTLRSRGLERKQFNAILLGTLITFSLIIVFNFVLPVIFNVLRFIPLAPVFILPFIAFTAFAIIRYHLLNTKIITTEVLTFLLAVSSLFEIVLANNFTTAAFRFFIFFLILNIGVLLNRSVQKEVRQRELLEKLTNELEDANEKLKALDQARSEFITIASHQLRTPPATIKWYLSALTSGDYGKFKKDQLEILNKATRTNNSQISLIDDMLNVSRIERGKMEFLFEPADLVTLAKITFEQLEPSAIDKHLKFTLKVPKKKLPSLMADKEKLRQVMNNLIDNAIKYTKEGTVEAKLETTPTEIIFSVTDSGKGISDTEKSGIFEKFSRGKQSVMQSSGLGLGLYVAKVVIEQHKGQIWAESEGPGKGSKFIFSLPINSGLSKTTLVDLAQGK
jgi:signal transduction histidine kinase